MNKLYFLLFILFLLISCGKPSVFHKKLEINLLNKLNNSIHFNMEISSPSWDSIKRISLLTKINDSSRYIYNYEGNYRNIAIGFYIDVYNLDDTSSYLKITPSSFEFDNRKNKILKDNWTNYIINDSHQSYKLTVTDSFLTLFKKDTSMLTKFKDYYNK